MVQSLFLFGEKLRLVQAFPEQDPWSLDAGSGELDFGGEETRLKRSKLILIWIEVPDPLDVREAMALSSYG